VTAPRWEVVVAASAERQLARLPAKIAAAVVEFLLEPLAANPHVVGHRLRRELEGLWSARRGNYRIVYEIDEAERRVVVLRVEHRADVYRPR
jgi:mRNA-degrading endonuclease RelE of RelBE toxin-antitoxin system